MRCIVTQARSSVFFFFFNDTATTEIYTLSLHDALPISIGYRPVLWHVMKYYAHFGHKDFILCLGYRVILRSEEHTSELQSRLHLVCRLLLEKKKPRSRKITK